MVQNLAHIIGHWASKTPNAIAVSDHHQQQSYGDLWKRSSAIATALLKHDVDETSIVAVLVERNIHLPVALLGILLSGASYCPMDPVYPMERLVHMIEASNTQHLICSASLLPLVKEMPCKLNIIEIERCVEEDSSPLPVDDSAYEEWKTFRPQPPYDHKRAYVIFTSGSTGLPKGVEISQLALVNLLFGMQEVLHLSHKDVLFAVTTICFDIAALELFLPLVVGARVHIAITENPLLVVQAMREIRPTIVQATPTLWQFLLDAGWEGDTLMTVLCGGEALPAGLGDRLSQCVDQLWNVYGPTEATVWALATLYDSVLPSCIGVPLANYTAFVLNDAMESSAEGQLYLGGMGLANGYIGRDDLTRKAFIEWDGQRIYATGDLVRRGKRGIEFLGRADTQVKIRGHRVELGEIESVLSEHPNVQRAICLWKKEIGLAAFLVVDTTTQKVAETKDTLELWKQVWDEVGWGAEDALHNPLLNFSGYIDSFTGNPHLPQVVLEWVEAVCVRIASLEPRVLWEMGAGSGMITFRLAPDCHSVVAADMSGTACQYLENVMKHPNYPALHFDHVHVLEAAADEYSKLAPHSEAPDMIVCNGVSMYFPSLDYLATVVKGALDHLAPGGCFFLGDVRHYGLHREFHAARLGCGGNIVEKACQEDKELLVDPRYLQALGHSLPSCDRVVIQVKRGHYKTEFTKYRYDVWFFASGSKEEEEEEVCMYPHPQEWTVGHTLAQIISGKEDILWFHNVPDLRVYEDRVILGKRVPSWEGVDPEQVYCIAQELGYEAYIMNRGEDPALLDIVLSKMPCIVPDAAPFLSNMQLKDSIEWCNQKAVTATRIADAEPLNDFLCQRLPDYMVPTLWMELNGMPLTDNGKVKRGALLELLPRSRVVTDVPQTPMEKAISLVWSRILHCSHTEIGRNDTFFELGGHSLSAAHLVHKINGIVGHHVLSIVDVRDKRATLRGMAQVVERACVHGLDQVLMGLRQDREIQWNQPVVIQHTLIGWNGVHLACRLWLPTTKPPFPCIVTMSPYRTFDMTHAQDKMNMGSIASRGIACICVDTRGTGNSGGWLCDEYTTAEVKDMECVVEWAIEQEWCSRKIGLMGFSYSGFTALNAASSPTRSPHVKLVVAVASSDNHFVDDCHWMGGVPVSDGWTWATRLMAQMSLPMDPRKWTKNEWMKQWKDRLTRVQPLGHRWLSHPFMDEYWKQGCASPSKMDVPLLLASGWYAGGGYTNALARVMAQAQGPRRYIVGNYEHAWPHMATGGPPIDFLQIVCDAMHKEPTGVSGRLCMLNTTLWHDVEGWSTYDNVGLGLLPGTMWMTLPMSKEDEWVRLCDPHGMPVGLAGGRWFSQYSNSDGPVDQHSDDKASLCLDMDVNMPIHIAGGVRCTFSVRKEETSMVCVRLCDVSPDGKSTRVAFGVASCNKSVLTVQLYFCAHIFRKGHVLRLAFSDHYWPMLSAHKSIGQVELLPCSVKLSLPVLSDTVNLVTDVEDSMIQLQPKCVLPSSCCSYQDGTFLWKVEKQKDGSHNAHFVDDEGKWFLPEVGVYVSRKTTEDHVLSLSRPWEATSFIQHNHSMVWDKIAVDVSICFQVQGISKSTHCLTTTLCAKESGSVVMEKAWKKEVIW